MQQNSLTQQYANWRRRADHQKSAAAAIYAGLYFHC